MKNKKIIIIIFFIILFISIGFAYLTTNLNINGISLIKKNSWDVHFANLVDDAAKSEVNIPATISENKMAVNFEVTLSKPGDNYYFYVDVVNEGTIDAMLESFEVTGLTENQKKYLEWNVTYSDGITLTKKDILKAKNKEILKVTVSFIEDVNLDNLPTIEEKAQLTFKSVYVQADQSAHERKHNEDREGPVVRVSTSKSTTTGNNNWYKNLLLTTKLIDYNGIKSAKYCLTTAEECTPTTPAELVNNSFEVQLQNSKDPWTICVESTDNANNTEKYCDKNKYYVDGESPTITSVNVVPNDDTLSISINGKDTNSSVYKYYFSKDSGHNFVSSLNSNYTFTSLEDGDYLVVVYIEDMAGNISLTSTSSVTIRHKNLCEKNNITNLGDCLIATEVQNGDVVQAKEIIQNKGAPDFSKTSPTYKYKIIKNENTTNIKFTNSYKAWVGTGLSFDENLGVYSLENSQQIPLSDINFEDGQEHFMCSDGNLKSNCSSAQKINSLTVGTNQDNGAIIFNMNINYYSSDVISYNQSEVGMYATTDDIGTSYYYRGSVGGNIVKFGSNYWQVIRINGDGTLRLIYIGPKANVNATAFTEYYSEELWDPTFAGYMNNTKSFSKNLIESNNSTYGSSKINETAVYYYSKAYNYDAETNMFYLDKTEDNVLSGTLKGSKDTLISNAYYTCFNNNIDEGCHVLMKVVGWGNEITARVKYLSYGSTSYDNAVSNVDDSTVKAHIDKWYEENIKNKYDSKGVSLHDYVKDEVFCNDRSLASGDGYRLNGTTYYGSRNRIMDYSPSLICPQENDKFSVSEDIGNGDLTYPVGLITIDEVAMAGGVQSTMNQLYFLKNNLNTTSSVLTMSPQTFNSSRNEVLVYTFDSLGRLTGPWTYSKKAIKPVINIDPSKFTFTGNGTKDDPYVIE